MFAGMLSGCAVVGPLLSVGGMAGLAPLQYASIAYTVGEYSYEYAANDKTPDEVIEGKIDAVVSGDAFVIPASLYERETAGPEAPVMMADVEQTPTMAQEARQQRIESLLGRRQMQFERLEVRRMAFLKAKSNDNLSLRQTAMADHPDLFNGAKDEVSLD